MADPTDPTLPPEEAAAQCELIDILIDQTTHLGRHAKSPLRRIASGQIEQRLTTWKDEMQAHLGAVG